MKRKEISSTYLEYSSIEELSVEHKELMQFAIKNREQAYAPYSRFLVGASVLLDNGEMIGGSNQENAAYPSGLCAERVAIFAAGAQFPKAKIKAMAITCRNTNSKTDYPSSSCGACRQSMLEYELKQREDITIYFMGEYGRVWCVNSVKDLLPLFFDPNALK